MTNPRKKSNLSSTDMVLSVTLATNVLLAIVAAILLALAPSVAAYWAHSTFWRGGSPLEIK